MSQAIESRHSVWQRLRAVAKQLISIADEPGDDDDARLRKRVGVVAGYATIVAPLSLPLAAPTPLVGWVLALGLSLWSAVNLAVLARTKRFERYVIALIAIGPPFVLLATVLAGGVTHTPGLVWAFLVPAYALLALGPQRATPWFVVFVATLLVAVAMDPFVGGRVEPPPYATQLFFQGIGIPLAITFLLLRYIEIRRRAAEARSDELLTNAIPSSVATASNTARAGSPSLIPGRAWSSPTSSDSRRGPSRPTRPVSSRFSMTSSAGSTRSRPRSASRRSRP